MEHIVQTQAALGMCTDICVFLIIFLNRRTVCLLM